MNHGRVAVITGGARGVGYGIAEKLASEGDRVIVVDLLEDQGREAADQLGGEFFRADVSDEDSVADLAHAVERDWQGAEVLVNSAGLLQAPGRSESMPLGDHDRIWSVNYRGTYLCCRAFAPQMAARGQGAILNVGSTNSFQMMPLPAYAPTKAAIRALTELLAAEWGPRGVRVNTVAPGFARTPAFQAKIDAGERDPRKIAATTALGRLVEPSEIGEAAAFLCSDRASGITGVTLPVDCGWLAMLGFHAFPGDPEGA